MIKVIHKNLKKSSLAEQIVGDRLGAVIEKFPELRLQSVTAILEMENSPVQAGKDVFHVRVIVQPFGKAPVILNKKSEQLYQATAMLADRLMGTLSRVAKKGRQMARRRQRRERHNWDDLIHFNESEAS